MEVSSQVSLGVRTRARTLREDHHHRRLPVPSSKTTKTHHHHHTASAPACFDGSSMQTAYLELRSRKLEKIICRCHEEAATQTAQEGSTRFEGEASRMALSEGGATVGLGTASDKSSRRVQQQQSSVAHSRNNSATFSNAKPARLRRKDQNQRHHNQPAQPPENDPEDAMEVEVSFGENVMDLDSRERRTTRETTPSSHMRDVEAPGSTTRPAPPTSGRRRLQNEGHSRSHSTSHQFLHVPTSNEIEEFFAGAEQQEQRRFTERYNYDPVSDSPLPGRFEWVRLRRP